MVVCVRVYTSIWTLAWCYGVMVSWCFCTPCTLYTVPPMYCLYRFLKVWCSAVVSLRCVVPTGQKSRVEWTVGRLYAFHLHCTTATHSTSQPDRISALPCLALPYLTSSRPQQQTIPTSLRGTFILFSCYGYSLLVLALVPLYFTGRLSKA